MVESIVALKIRKAASTLTSSPIKNKGEHAIINSKDYRYEDTRVMLPVEDYFKSTKPPTSITIQQLETLLKQIKVKNPVLAQSLMKSLK